MEKKDLKNKTDVESKQNFATALQQLLISSNVSKDAVAAQTRISRNYIEALCDGNLEQLPGRVFGRGFIQCIAKMVKSDSKDLLRLYDECWATLEIFKPTSSGPKYENRPLRRATFAFNKLLLGCTLAAVAITVVAFIGLRPMFRSASRATTPVKVAKQLLPPPIAVAPVFVAPPAVISSADAGSIKALKVVAPEIKAAPMPIAVVMELIQFQVTEPVQIRSVVDGKISDYQTYNIGLHKFEFNQTAEMLIKDASLVEVTYNGKSLGELGKKGRIRRLAFQKSND